MFARKIQRVVMEMNGMGIPETASGPPTKLFNLSKKIW